ncbi:MAG: hypothetical protein J6S14_22065, partial [Clostridia bacterium]|nr:hypothetical protein [Clostridia bacterium]
DGGGDTSITYVESKPLVYQNNFEEYLKALKKPFEKVVRLDFLQEDEKGVAFSVGNVVANGYMTDHPTNAFIQSGSLNVNLQNGTRRTCTVKFGNADGKFRYAVDNLWYGTKIRLMMGLVLPDGTPFYIPQGVFLIKEPLTEWRPSERTVTFTLVDKFALLDGTLGGRLSYAHQVNSPINNRPNVFDVVQAFLHFDKFTLIDGNVPLRYIDPITPKFTDYYNGVTVTQTYSSGATETVPFTAVTYDLTLANGSTIANGIAELNSLLACWYGYDASGSFTMDASQDDFSDKGKPTLWDFTPDNSDFLAFSETAKNTELYNNVVICGQGSTYATYYGRAYNVDPASESNIYKIGLKTYWQNESNLCSEKQCKDLAAFLLKQKAFLSKSNSISCGQMFHLRENALVTVRRDDLAGAPTKRYLITSYSLPIEDGGQMQINCSEVDDSEGVKIKTEGGIG